MKTFVHTYWYYAHFACHICNHSPQPKTETFEFPDLYPKDKDETLEKDLEQVKNLQKEWEKNIKQHKHRPGMPSWFGAWPLYLLVLNELTDVNIECL